MKTLIRAGLRRHPPMPAPSRADEATQATWFAPTNEAWGWLAARVAELERMGEVRAAAQDCQVAVGRLSALGALDGPIRDEVEAQLNALALDVHHEARRLQARAGIAPITSRPGVREWLCSAVDSGEPVGFRGATLAGLRRSHRLTTGLTLLASLTATVSVLLNLPVVAMTVLLIGVTSTVALRYRSNAEATSTFRARYVTCLLGHAADVILLCAIAGARLAGEPRELAWFPLAAAIFLMAGIIVRTGALHGGVYVPRMRLEALVRAAAFAVALGLWGIAPMLGLAIMTALFALHLLGEMTRAFRRVWTVGATELAWTALTEDGVTSHVFTAPHPSLEPRPAILAHGSTRRHPSRRLAGTGASRGDGEPDGDEPLIIS